MSCMYSLCALLPPLLLMCIHACSCCCCFPNSPNNYPTLPAPYSDSPFTSLPAFLYDDTCLPATTLNNMWVVAGWDHLVLLLFACTYYPYDGCCCVLPAFSTFACCFSLFTTFSDHYMLPAPKHSLSLSQNMKNELRSLYLSIKSNGIAGETGLDGRILVTVTDVSAMAAAYCIPAAAPLVTW